MVVQLVRIPACHAGGRGFESRPYRHKYSEKVIQRPFRENVSAITWMSYGTFLLCLLIISEHVLKRPKRSKYSPTATIWLQLFRPNENCSQESVESTQGALIYSCYSVIYVELCKRDRREEVCAKTPVSGYNRQRSWLHFFFEDHGCSQKQSCVWRPYSEPLSISEATTWTKTGRYPSCWEFISTTSASRSALPV